MLLTIAAPSVRPRERENRELFASTGSQLIETVSPTEMLRLLRSFGRLRFHRDRR